MSTISPPPPIPTWPGTTEPLNLFPPPDKAYAENERRTIEVLGAFVLKAVTSAGSRDVLLITATKSGEDIYGFRFLLPNHSKVVRSFFRGGKIRDVPRWDDVFNVNTGVFVISFQGTIVGEDTIEGMEAPPKAIYVVENVSAQVLS